MNASEGTIREETPADHEAIRGLVIDAFGRPDEAVLIDRLRAEHPDAFGPALVAEVGGEIVGYVCCSEMRIDERPDAVLLGLGPIAVQPARQMMGIGSALMRRVQELATVPIALLGDPGWYGRFGFALRPRRWGSVPNGTTSARRGRSGSRRAWIPPATVGRRGTWRRSTRCDRRG